LWKSFPPYLEELEAESALVSGSAGYFIACETPAMSPCGQYDIVRKGPRKTRWGQ